jgi:hypothetical protein
MHTCTHTSTRARTPHIHHICSNPPFLGWRHKHTLPDPTCPFQWGSVSWGTPLAAPPTWPLVHLTHPHRRRLTGGIANNTLSFPPHTHPVTGWNKKWDEWVEQTGLQPASEAAALGLAAPPKAKAKAVGAAAGGAAAAAAAAAAAQAAAWQRGKASVDGGALPLAGARARGPRGARARAGLRGHRRAAAAVGDR